MRRHSRKVSVLAATLAAAALRAACPCAYVANGGTNALKVLDLSTNGVVATIPLGAAPFGAAVNLAGTRVYVTELYSNGLAVVDASTNTVVTTVTGFDVPWSVAVHPDGTRAYVSQTGQTGTGLGTVRVVNLANNTLGASIGVGDTPHGLALTPDGTRLFVANSLSGTVTVVNTADNSVATTLTGMTTPEAVATDLAGTRLYVADGGAGLVRVYTLPALAPVTTITVAAGPGELAVRPAGDRLHVAAGPIPGKLVIVNTATNAVMTTLTVGDGPAGVAFSPDGARSYVPNSGSLSNSVTVVNAANNTIATTITGLNAPAGRGAFIVSPPWAASLSPTQAQSGGAGFTLTVNGTGFIAASQVLWNGAARTTTVVNDRQLTATIPASDLAAAGSATITVNNPAPAGGVSPTGLPFTICSGPPSPGNGLTLSKASPNVHLAWNAVGGATSYNVRACIAPLSGSCTFSTIGTSSGNAWNDPVLGSGSSYRYAIEAVNACGPTP